MSYTPYTESERSKAKTEGKKMKTEKREKRKGKGVREGEGRKEKRKEGRKGASNHVLEFEFGISKSIAPSTSGWFFRR